MAIANIVINQKTIMVVKIIPKRSIESSKRTMNPPKTVLSEVNIPSGNLIHSKEVNLVVGTTLFWTNSDSICPRPQILKNGRLSRFGGFQVVALEPMVENLGRDSRIGHLPTNELPPVLWIEAIRLGTFAGLERMVSVNYLLPQQPSSGLGVLGRM